MYKISGNLVLQNIFQGAHRYKSSKWSKIDFTMYYWIEHIFGIEIIITSTG